MQITKDKNILMISEEVGKVYKIDLSTLTMYGIAGKPLKNLPKPLQNPRLRYDLNRGSIEHALVMAIVEIKENFRINAETLACLSLFERFYAVGLKVNSWSDIYQDYGFFSSIKLDGDLIEFIKQNNEGKVDKRALRNYTMRDFRAKYPLTDRQFAYLTDIVENCDGGDDLMEFVAVNIIHKHVEMMNNWHYTIREFYRLGVEMGKDWKKEKFVFDAYCRYKFEYEIFKNKAINDKIAKRYDEKLLFETEDCLIVMPKSLDDFKFEGDNNSNCVAGYANDHADGDTIIVFVRKKSAPEKSYITCQIEPKSRRIRQYRTSHNNNPDEMGRNFQVVYQNYLNTLT